MQRLSHSAAYWTLSLFALFLVCSNVEGANWLRVAEVKGRFVVYIDPASIKMTGKETAIAWTREVPVEPVMMGDETLIGVTSYTEFRCKARQFRTMEANYSYESGKTERIAAEGMRTWKKISRESTKKIYDYLCKRP